MHTTPISLLERLHQPAEPLAWEQFVDLYTPLLYSWTRRLGLQPADAADLVQDIFTILVRKLPEFQYDRHKSFRGWLRTILTNKWRNRQRDQAQEALQAPAEALAEVPAGDAADALEEAEYRRYLVHRALQLMQADFQPLTWQACWEFVVAGKPAAQVSQELGISLNAVYLAKSRVLHRLREELKGLLD